MTTYNEALEAARELGQEHGANAASWFDTNDPAKILQGIEDGDPEILDFLPAPDLSGEWADRITGPQLVADVTGDAESAQDWFDDICSEYEMAFATEVEHQIARYCTELLAEDAS